MRKVHLRRRVGSYGRSVIRACLLAAASLTLVAAAPAIAAPSKGAQVPAFTLHLLQNRFGDQTYAPTRIPSGFRYSRWQKVNDSLVLTFKERTSTDSFRFEASRLAPAAPCDGGGAFRLDTDRYRHHGTSRNGLCREQ